jgi:hypothetical protein
LFGFGPSPQEKTRYLNEVRRLRFQRLREALERLKPQAIVCMGQQGWADFREAFTLREENADRSHPVLQVFAEGQIILAPHWGKIRPAALPHPLTPFR